MSYQIHVVKEAAKGHWCEIFGALAPQLNEAVDRAPNHVSCPVHGGTDGFRLFPHWEETGAGICNTCGAYNDGFALLQWVTGWSFNETVNKVGAFLRLDYSSAQIISTETEGSKFSGEIRFIGMTKLRNGRDCFLIRFTDGSVHWGADLKRACELAGLKVGDTVELTLVAKQKAINSKGKEFTKTLWSARRLPSAEEIRAEEEKKAAVLEKRRLQMRALWKSSEPLALSGNNPASLYLRNRGIKEAEFNPINLSDLRYVPQMSYVDEDGKVSSFPGFIALVRDKEGAAITLHRTFLTQEGKKASISCPKKLMPIPFDRSVNGCAIHLGNEPSDVLCVAEGIETALSVVTATGFPCWSAISAHGLETIEIPSTVKTVCIFADKDKSFTGQEAANKLKQRLKASGIRAFVFLPEENLKEDQRGVDWNDHLLMFGPDSFPI